MSNTLSPKPFVDQSVSEVQGFDCGSAEWATPISDWIKGKEALSRVRKGTTKIWLYYNEANDLVGYGSVGITKWPIFAEEPRKPVLILPSLGVQEKHQSKGYGKLICNHLISEAQKLYSEARSKGKTLLPLLCLLVHPLNNEAKRLYAAVGFSTYEYYYEEAGTRYLGMARLLNYT